MASAASRPSAKATPPAESLEAPAAKDNKGRELLELRIRWKIVNETVEAGLVERKRLREAIDALSKEVKQTRGEE